MGGGAPRHVTMDDSLFLNTTADTIAEKKGSSALTMCVKLTAPALRDITVRAWPVPWNTPIGAMAFSESPLSSGVGRSRTSHCAPIQRLPTSSWARLMSHGSESLLSICLFLMLYTTFSAYHSAK